MDCVYWSMVYDGDGTWTPVSSLNIRHILSDQWLEFFWTKDAIIVFPNFELKYQTCTDKILHTGILHLFHLYFNFSFFSQEWVFWYYISTTIFFFGRESLPFIIWAWFLLSFLLVHQTSEIKSHWCPKQPIKAFDASFAPRQNDSVTLKRVSDQQSALRCCNWFVIYSAWLRCNWHYPSFTGM